MISVDKEFSVSAFELKYVYINKKGRIMSSYCKGMEGTLFILNYVFENVALWQFFNASRIFYRVTIN
jgi:hypothetical protein